MQATTLMMHLEHARSAIRKALTEWDPADLRRVDESRDLLVAAVGDLRLFERAISAGDVPVTGELYANILAIKQDITRATRVVDACVAFHRGLVARTGDAPPGYDSGGRLTGELGALEPEVLA